MIRVPSPMGMSLRCLIDFSFLSLSVSSAYGWALLGLGPFWACAVRRGNTRTGGGPGPRAVATPERAGNLFLPDRWDLLAEPEALDGGAIAPEVLPLQIVEQAAA